MKINFCNPGEKSNIKEDAAHSFFKKGRAANHDLLKVGDKFKILQILGL